MREEVGKVSQLAAECVSRVNRVGGTSETEAENWKPVALRHGSAICWSRKVKVAERR